MIVLPGFVLVCDSNTEACEGMRKLVIKVDSGIAASYKVPGQYTKARSDSSQVRATIST